MGRILIVAAAIWACSAASSRLVAGRPPGQVRVVFLEVWRSDLFERERRPDIIPNAIFDVSIPLADIPPDADASFVLAQAERRAARRRHDFTNRVILYRWLEGPGVLRRVGASSLRSGSLSLMEELENGDILVFFGPDERF